MGVYIKGMEMPKGRPVCIVIDAAGQARRYDLNNDRYADDKLFEAVPVQPHGRLIDADALLMRINHEVMEAYMDGVCYGVHPSQEYLYLLGEIIDDAPTIIPASFENLPKNERYSQDNHAEEGET